MKTTKIIFLAITLIGVSPSFSQAQDQKDRLMHELSIAKHDTTRAYTMSRLSQYYKWNNPDSAIYYGNMAITLARQINFPYAELNALDAIVLTHLAIGNDSKALQINFEAIKIAEKNSALASKSRFLLHSGVLYSKLKDFSKAMNLYQESKIYADSAGDFAFSIIAQGSVAETFLSMNQLDSALQIGILVDKNADLATVSYPKQYTTRLLGSIYFERGENRKAIEYFKQSLLISSNLNFKSIRNYSLAQVYRKMEENDSSIYFAKKALEAGLESGILSNIIDANVLLSRLYEKGDKGKALEYSILAIALKDSLDFIRSRTGLEAFTDFDLQERQNEIEAAEIRFQNQLRTNAFLGSTFTLLVIGFFLFRNNRIKQKAKMNIESAYNQLKSTQSQLIQSEKMASLGELTAGIAHEIQNPLNFVNNFSDVNKELADELLQEIRQGNVEEAESIAKDIISNEDKILHHGKRADGIVKGMLQHSRGSSGEKELTDINELADEYLRLAYHGLRAKDKSFNADFKTELDPNLPKVNVVPQDIGRVLLNLINNAFFAVSQKSKAEAGSTDYKPTVTVSTKHVPLSEGVQGEGTVQISIKDNGQGIPDSIKEKIFQPFFTTKSTGEGTGLGLSLSYDIITKGHGGELSFKSEKNMSTEFIIRIPTE